MLKGNKSCDEGRCFYQKTCQEIVQQNFRKYTLILLNRKLSVCLLIKINKDSKDLGITFIQDQC